MTNSLRGGDVHGEDAPMQCIGWRRAAAAWAVLMACGCSGSTSDETSNDAGDITNPAPSLADSSTDGVNPAHHGDGGKPIGTPDASLPPADAATPPLPHPDDASVPPGPPSHDASVPPGPPSHDASAPPATDAAPPPRHPRPIQAPAARTVLPPGGSAPPTSARHFQARTGGLMATSSR